MSEIIVAFLLLVLVLIAVEAVRRLTEIRDILKTDFLGELKRSIAQAEIVVPPEKKEVLCKCKHTKKDHEWAGHIDPTRSSCGIPGCGCTLWRPTKGPWPSDPVKI